ncbi:hypothetical protein [Streptomyces heilongjiangensis]|uniref:DUF222 domain-containing protein n=1 Tax=Streptomyces heilongjiangensis TaxID=945052 RepID=A0ABW1BJ50_9ACTN|nr:hypothetical protein [Streptomyces heilongjiangensis]MDC2951053.1 hypothetical protein [Streptomyces heilongjiangensis]
MAQCEICGTEMTQGRGPARRTCSAACRQAAHRRRQGAELESLRAAALAGSAQQITTLRDALLAGPAAQITSLRDAVEAGAHEGAETLKAAAAAQMTGHIETLRRAGQFSRPALPLLPPATRTATPPDDSPAGQIQAAGADLLAVVSTAAALAERQWAGGATPEDSANAVRVLAERVAAAVLASAPKTSRSEPDPEAVAEVPPADTAGPAAARVPQDQAPDLDAEPSRARRAPARRKPLSQKAARAVADSARLVKGADHRDTHRWDLAAEDGTVLGHVVPSYGGTGRTGRNGWTYRLAGSSARSGGRPYKTRDEAAVQCALSWMRVATARATD